MRKRKRPEPDPCELSQYEPNVGRLWDCMRMASDHLFPSLRFLATLAWHRSRPEDLVSLQSGDHRVLQAPPGLPPDLWTELVWVLSDRRYLQLPSGARVMASITNPSGRCPVYLRWCLEFPKAAFGKNLPVESADWKYECLDDVGLVQAEHVVRMRRHPLRDTTGIYYDFGKPIPAVTKRGRWFAPRPRQIADEVRDLPELPPPYAQRVLDELWRRKEAGNGYISLQRFVHDQTWGLGFFPKPGRPEGPEPDVHLHEKFLNILIWLYLDGQVDLAAFRRLGGGPHAKYRDRQHHSRNLATMTRMMPTLPHDYIFVALRNLLHDNDTIASLREERWRVGRNAPLLTKNHHFTSNGRFHPLVWRTLLCANLV